ncbi:endonuclease/exonuclease/phosphatase family protein [Salinimicrobium gaetbulicola]|uniref:Endonuclease/exonuclease/phosphatase family protein n=1 Tax=Salinimicrobium gaetbulicola TaxID=999702 RepID=A0ABW3IFK1_9FLAO
MKTSPKFPLFLYISILILISSSAIAQVKICSWNIQHFGKSKSAQEMEFIANTLKDFDVIAIQEVVAGNGGPQAVARLADQLNRKGQKWDYAISEPTQGTPYSSERYAFIWKTAKVQRLGKPWLDKNYELEIDREPFCMDFKYKDAEFTVVSLHAIPKNKQPETELKYLKFLPDLYTSKNLVFLGDFNTAEDNSVFIPLKNMCYLPALIDQKTSLRTKCTPHCLASEYDNIFVESEKVQLLKSGVVHFYESFPDLKAARKISDHIPVWAEIDFPKKEEILASDKQMEGAYLN